jgi:quercetin dioxygenase-like cupin family protein
MRHRVLRPDDRAWQDAGSGPGGGDGLRQRVVIDESCGSVHMTVRLADLAAGGEVRPHVHSVEKTVYVLAGRLDLAVGDRVHTLSPDDYALVPVAVPHALRAGARGGARWLEVIAPQARAEPKDTFALDTTVNWETATEPDWASPLRGAVGRFADDQLPPPSRLQMEGYSGGDVTGIRLKMLVDRVFGSQHMNVFMVEFQPGGAGNSHDHPFEEAYVIVSGKAEALLDGEHYQVGPGDVVWTGVGGVHGFFPAGPEPVRWIEVQAPQPPAQHAFRFLREWQHVEKLLAR